MVTFRERHSLVGKVQGKTTPFYVAVTLLAPPLSLDKQECSRSSRQHEETQQNQLHIAEFCDNRGRKLSIQHCQLFLAVLTMQRLVRFVDCNVG